MEPVFTIDGRMLNLVAEIVKKETELNHTSVKEDLHLRRTSRIHSVSASVRIEQNTLSENEIIDCINGIAVLGPADDIRAAQNAWKAYGERDHLNPYSIDSLLNAHGVMMAGLTGEAGAFRRGNVGIADSSGNIIHMGAVPSLVPGLVSDLLSWVRKSDAHMLIKAAAFHSEFEMIHPFADGNGRMGRLWHSLLLSGYDTLYAFVPIENVILENQEDYYHALNISSVTGDSTEFIVFMLSMIDQALAVLAGKAPDRTVPSRWEVISSFLDRNDYIANKDVREICAVSPATASRILKQLEEERRLVRIRVGKVTAYVRK